MNIGFAHNVHKRLQILKETILIEKELFPECYTSVAYNDLFINIFNEINNVEFTKFNDNTHKIGCTNGSVLSVKPLLDKPVDIIIFSHDDVKINKDYLSVLMNHIDNILNKNYDIVCRNPKNFYGSNYYMMVALIMSKEAAIKIFEKQETITKEEDLPRDFFTSLSPEVWLFNIINDKNLNIKVIPYENKNDDHEYNKNLGEAMGYYHINAGKRGWI